MAYGYEVQEGDDPLVDLVDRAVEEFSISTRPGAFLVDTLPVCESILPLCPRVKCEPFLSVRHVPAWIPGAGWKKKAQVWADDLEMTCNVPYAFTQQQMVTIYALRDPSENILIFVWQSAGTAIPSFTSAHLESNPDPEQEILIKNAAASLYSGISRSLFPA